MLYLQIEMLQTNCKRTTMFQDFMRWQYTWWLEMGVYDMTTHAWRNNAKVAGRVYVKTLLQARTSRFNRNVF
jgi:hypothetical protein